MTELSKIDALCIDWAGFLLLLSRLDYPGWVSVAEGKFVSMKKGNM